MQMTTASDMLKDTLNIESENRYPASIRLWHLGEAMQLLAREYEVRMNEGQYTRAIPSSGQIDMSAVYSDELNFEYATTAWVFTSFSGTGTDANAYGPIGATKLMEYFDYDSFMQDYKTTTETVAAAPEAFISYGRWIIIRPIPSETTYVRFNFRGIPPDSPTGEPWWMRVAPWAVIYRAAEIGSVWLEDESRVPVYRNLRQEQMEAINIADSMRGDVVLESTEV
jgi:hypothetical protein